ncbi:MAG: class I SAM-dependent methyltransferase [Rhodospirillaceae bacterium]|nr:class I SAM-dependent methyltransferase [Rhodospirillaceae bacterium]
MSPLTEELDKEKYRKTVHELCDSLTVPGADIPADAEVVLSNALLSRDFDVAKLCTAALHILISYVKVQVYLNAAWRGDVATLDRFLADGSLIAFLNTRLMQALLVTTPIPQLAFERLLIHARRYFLEKVVQQDQQFSDEILSAATAVSIYGFLSEYIFPESAAEKQSIESLLRRFEKGSSERPDLLTVAVLGAYRPLNDLSVTDAILSYAALSPMLADLIRVQIKEPRREREIADGIPSITPVIDEVSIQVRLQYEEHPYPRWMTHTDNDPAIPLDYFTACCAEFDSDAFGEPEHFSILVAGCGTGRVAIEDKLVWPESEMLAVDLSLTSLAYGARRALDLGLEKISFAQGDILELPALDRTFDYVTCTGVLHHMTDPIEGWRALAGLLRPGGMMRICLYSAKARQSVRNVRNLIGPRGDTVNSQKMRVIREGLVAQILTGTESNEALHDVFNKLDVYSMSMCRDLLFHVQEQDFTIPRVELALKDLDLRFCGFVDSSRSLLTKYRTFAPKDERGLSLKNWHRFESEYPQTFNRMYDFMVQKPL